jgi:hypothetical protein
MSASGYNAPLPSTLGPQTPSDILELRAAEQRRRLHNTVQELRQTVRERMDVRKTARQYLWPAAGVAAILGLVMGYGTGGAFVR